MASLCKRQQCTIDRRGFRQELDSWRHKLLHCVGFESILEGLFDPELGEDLKLLKDSEPATVSDWSFDENCLFCCLRRDKVKEHLIGLSDEGLEDTTKHLLVKDQITISRLEKQAEEFLNAVLCRKDVPNFSDPHIPVVAREILQRMIRQFAAEYTSKTSSPQDSRSDPQPHSDQSLSTPPLLSVAPPPATSPVAALAGPTHNQNPVLSKLLMADQDAPLDLTIKKPAAEPTEQDGVLDLSIKKTRCSSSLPIHSPASMIKGESSDISVAKAKDLQSTSTLEQFMAKLCPHHQRQIIDAIGFLQTEVKAHASSVPSAIHGTPCSGAKSSPFTPEKSHSEVGCPSQSIPKSEVQDLSYFIPSSCTMKQVAESAVSLKTFVSTGPALNLRSPQSGNHQVLATSAANSVDAENNRHGDHAPLKMKIMTSNVAAGKRLSCVLNTSLSSHTNTLEDRQGNSDLSSRTESQSARLSSSAKRHSQVSHIHQARQREVLRHVKNTPTKVFPVHMAIPSDTIRTARKTIKASTDNQTRDSVCRGMIDPDLGHCDIVFIDKPITECFKKRQRCMAPRRNARKSTRGHLYSDEIWELKTVRTLAGRGNCPNPMPELITLVTPKQMLSKPDGVPPVHMPFVAACTETMNQEMSTEESGESVIPGTGEVLEVAASNVEVVVETSQTGQCQSKGQSDPPSPERSSSENQESSTNTDVAQEVAGDSESTMGNEESSNQVPVEAEKDHDLEPQEGTQESTEQVVAETVVETLENASKEEAEVQPPSEELSSESVLLQSSAGSPLNQVEEKIDRNVRQEKQEEQPQELQSDTQIPGDNSETPEKVNTTSSEETVMVQEADIEPSEDVDDALSLEAEDDDVSTKTLDALLNELPPWRRKKGTKILLPKRLRQKEVTIVGYVNGRPISASDRHLRRRESSTSPPFKSKVKARRANKNLVDSAIENKPLENPLSETHTPVKSIETPPASEQVTDPSVDTRSTATRKCPVRTKQLRKQKRGRRALNLPSRVESKRQLRSANQKSAGTPATSSDAISSPVAATLFPPTTEPLSSLPPPPPPAVPTSPSTRPSEPSGSEQSTRNTVPETVEVNTENTQRVETSSEEIQKCDVESSLQAKPKLRSANTIAEKSKNEKPQSSGEVMSPLESASPVKSELQKQIIPLRRKRVPQNESEGSEAALLPKSNVAFSEDKITNGDDGSSSVSDRPTRMPLRSESTRTEMPCQSISQSPQADNKKLALRSQKLAEPSTSRSTVGCEVSSPVRILPERVTKAQVWPTLASTVSLPHSSRNPFVPNRHDAPKPTTNKFFKTLTGEESQHLITNLNIRYDKMQKGWVQMDKEGQPATKYKNKSDRQAAIWKSKRRIRKPKSSEYQKYSPVQMLFMKGFNLSSICHWFLESTETKSLVIVKKVNTRLPSETQLCFHSSSSGSGTSQGVFPSLQAERLKKHLKKFAIASPVKSNPKNQKLIAKALEQESVAIREKGEIPSTSQALNRSGSSVKACAQTNESHKSSGKSKNPASARILRKYSSIREKMQVQQTTARMKGASKIMKTKSMKKVTKSTAKSNLKATLKARKSALPVSKQMKQSAAKMERRRTLAGRTPVKQNVQEKNVKAQISSRAPRDANRKELPKRSSQRLESIKVSGQNPADAPKSKVDSKKHPEAEKAEVEKVNKVNSATVQTKESSHGTVTEVRGAQKAAETPRQNATVKVPPSPDQVLTRSQRKMEVAEPVSGGSTSKRSTKSSTTQDAAPKSAKKANEPTQTRSSALKPAANKRKTVLLPRKAKKTATKRVQELLETPAKRTRTSLSK